MSEDFSDVCSEIINSVEEVVVADQDFLEDVLIGLTAKGHILIEDVPGTGKTLTARSFAHSLGLSFNRIQFTPDMLPSDITGSHVYNEDEGVFEFKQGPIFANVVLADEINRAPPKTQAALLEAMGEKQVSVDNDTLELPEPFFVIATQNPFGHEGTFALPEAEKDRFMVKTSIGYPDRSGEKEILNRRSNRNSQMPEVSTVYQPGDIRNLQSKVEEVNVDEKIIDYIVDICRMTRDDDRVEIGISPRGVQRLYEASRSRALINSREFVVPQDVKSTAPKVLKHRIVLTTKAEVDDVKRLEVLEDILNKVKLPEV